MHRFAGRSQRGSLIVIAMIFAALLAISLTSYVVLNTRSLKLAQRSFYGTEAMNMAESGLEEAIWSFNQAFRGDTGAWTGWDTSTGVSATRTFSDFALGPNVTGTVKVYVERYNPPSGMQPKVLVEATVRLPQSDLTIKRMLEAKVKRRSYFAGGLVAKNNITFNGNSASVDSWISDPDNSDATPAVPYSSSIRRDKGTIGATAVSATITVGNADIWGTAAVGGTASTAISVGSNGRVGPFGTGAGVKNPASIATDFGANMEQVTAPSGGTVVGSLGATVGTAGSTTVLRVPSITDSLTVYGDVTIILTVGPGVDSINLAGSEFIRVTSGSTLSIYTEGDVNLSGNGLINENDAPKSFQLWGTSTSATPQDIQITGNSAIKGVVYAPNAEINITGNGDIMGAAVGREITLGGNANFHYDESLANWGVNTPYGITKWREVGSAAERATHASLLAF